MLRGLAVILRQGMRLRLTGVGLSPLLAVAFPAAFVAMVLLATTATTLSPAQERAKEFGRFDAFAGYGVVQVKPGDDAAAQEMLAAVASARPRETMLSINAVDFYVGGLASVEARFEEHTWGGLPFPERYRLDAGSWPRRAGEVAIAGEESVPVGRVLRLAGGGRLRVVGLVEDHYAREPAVLAAPGTWAGLDATLADRYVTMRAQPVVYWRGGDDEQVLSSMRRALPRIAPGSGDSRATLKNSYSAAPSLTTDRSAPWKEKFPAAYGLPVVVFPFLTVFLACLFADRRRRRLVTVGRALGLRPRILTLGHLLPLGLALIAASLVGWATGVAIMHLARGPMGSLAGHPLDLNVDWYGPLSTYAATVALAVVLTAVVLLRVPARADRPHGGEPAPNHPRRNRSWKLPVVELRRLGALGLGCVGVMLGATLETPPDALLASTAFMAAAIMAFPDAFNVIIRHLPTRHWVLRLAAARIAARRAVSLTTVLTLALLTGLTFGYLVLLQTWLTSAQAERAPEVSPGEVLVTARGSQLDPPRQSTVELLERVLPASTHSVRLTRSITTNAAGDTLGLASLGASPKPLMLADDLDDAQDIIGRTMSGQETNTLTGGGAVVWHGGDLPGRVEEAATFPLREIDENGTDRVLDPELPAVLAAVPPNAWRLSVSGVMLTETANRFDAPTKQGPVLFTAPDTGAVADIRAAVQSAGIDPETVLTHAKPEPPIPAFVLPAAAAALCVLLFLQSVTATWSSAKANTNLLRLLITLGISPRHARAVLWSQYAVIFGTASILGAVLAVLPVATLLVRLPGYQLSVPTTNIAALAAAVLLACTAAVALSSIRLHASTRNLNLD